MSSFLQADSSASNAFGTMDSASGGRLPRDRGSLWVLFIVLLAQLWTLGRLEGYQLADSVEYMDRAWDVARGHGVGPESDRSFAFSGLLLPFFWIANSLGFEDLKPVVSLLRALQMAVGLFTIAVLIRTATRLYSLRIAWLCALLLGLSPVFLRYSITPMSGPLAMLFMLLGFEALFAPAPQSKRGEGARGLIAGCWLGLGLLVAYQTMLVAAPMVLVGLFRDRLKRPRFWLSVMSIYVALAIAQCFLDLAIYDKFGSTLMPYLGSNGGAILSRIFWELGLEDLGAEVYLNFVEHEAIREDHLDKKSSSAQIQPMGWYALNMSQQLLAMPILALAALGFALCLFRPSWVRSAVTLTVIANAVLMSLKGAKSFRLWLPILPLIALAAGDALFLLFHSGKRKGAWLFKLSGGLAVAGGLVGGVLLTQAIPLKRFGDFWSAIELVGERAREFDTEVTVASSYHWATLFRPDPKVKLIKLSHDLGDWQGLSEAAQERVLMELSGIDFFITHRQAIEQDPRLMQIIGSRYRLHEIFLHPESAPQLGPVLLLVAPRPEIPLSGRSLFLHQRGVERAAIARVRSQIQNPSDLTFEHESADGARLSAAFLGWNLETGLRDGSLAWITYYWWARETDGLAYRIRDRITDNLGRELWNNEARAYGVHPTSAWEPNSLIRESYLVQIPRSTRAFGGPYARGELIPTEVYLSMETIPREGEGEPVPVQASTGQPLAPATASDGYASTELRPIGAGGRRWNQADMIQAGAAWIPVPPEPLFPADGGQP